MRAGARAHASTHTRAHAHAALWFSGCTPNAGTPEQASNVRKADSRVVEGCVSEVEGSTEYISHDWLALCHISCDIEESVSDKSCHLEKGLCRDIRFYRS